MVAPIYLHDPEMASIMPRSFSCGKRSLARDLILQKSPGSFDLPKHVVIVMDGLKKPSMKLLEWVLKNVTLDDYYTITLLGVMPWLNIPLSCKTWSEIWMMNIEDLVTKKECRSDIKYFKVQPLVDLCRKYGVIPQVKTLMGFPLRALVVERIASLHATLVVIDRHHDRKYIEFYAEKVPCNIVAMNDHGEFEMFRARSGLDTEDYSITGESPAPSTPKLMISDHFLKIFKLKVSSKSVEDRKIYFGG